ncbi:MAG: choice-of-anchor D domain-containing protein [Muribaculaceae bacterium]|nr:choice-of-anchor D domain-containing protein [Muribaculaceae bacterium]
MESTELTGLPTGLTECFSGTPASGSNEYVITFDNPYDYEGGNLAIRVDLTSTGGNCPRVYWYGEDQNTNTSRYSVSSSSSSSGNAVTFLPKATFNYTAGERPDYLVDVLDESLAFDIQGVNTSTTLNVTLKNRGNNAVTPTVSGLAAPFSTTYTATELASRATMTIPVTFSPTAVGEYTGAMTINCGDAGTFNVSLSGSGEMVLILCDGSTGSLATNEGIPIYGYYYDTKDTKTRFIYPSSKLTSLVGKQITSVTFYSTNDRATLNGGELSFYAGETSDVGALSATVDDLTEVWKGAMSPGGKELTFVFNTPMTYSGGNLAFGSNVNVKGTYEHINWYGESMDYASGCYRSTNTQFLPKVKISYAEPQDYAMTVNAESIDFGTVVVGGSKTLNVKVTNSGAQAITPAVSGLAAPFSTDYTAAELAAAAYVNVPVTFAPTQGGDFTATLTIDGGQAGTKTVTITGTGLAVPTGYQETFDAITAEAKIPAGWKAVKVQGTTLTNVSDYEESDYAIDVMDVDGGGKAIAFNKVSSREDYVYYLYYLISPEIRGDVFITAKHTQYQYTSNRFRVFNVDADGTILASTGSEGSEVTVNWIPALSADEWSYGTFNMPESGRVAILMGYAEMDFFAADEVVMAPSLRIDGLEDVPDNATVDNNGTAHFQFDVVVTNNGLTDVAAGDYNLMVFSADDLATPLATIAGNALAQGVTASQSIEFDYTPADLQPSQLVRFEVIEDMTLSYAITDYINVRAQVPIASLLNADGTALPEKTDVGVFRGSRTMNFVLANEGTAPLTYEITPVEGVTIAPLSGTVEGDQQVTVTATFATPGVFDGTVATIATNAGDFTVAASAACLNETTFLEDFEDDLDATWIVGSSYTFSDRSSSTFGSPDDTYNKKLAYVSIINYDDGELISPAVEFNAETGLDLHLTTYGVAFSPIVTVSYSTNRVDWVDFDGVTTEHSEFVNNTLTLPAEGTYYFMFDVYGAAIDDIFGGTLANLAHDAMISDFAGPTKGMVNKSATYTAVLRNMKPEADSFSVSLMDGENVVDIQEVANLEDDIELTFTYMPHEAGTHTLRVVATVEDYSVASAALTVEVAEENAVDGIVINEGTDLNNAIPHTTLYYYHSGGKFLYTADDMAGQVKAGDKIVKIGFLYQANDFIWDMPDFRIWAGNSQKTTFTDAKEVPISLDGLTQVFDCGELDEPFDNTRDGEMTYTFTEPIIYDGNTLEIVVSDDNDSYRASRVSFYGTDVTGRYQSEVWKMDGAATPVGEEKINSLTESQLSLSTFLPTIVIYVEGEPATVSGTVTDGENPVEGAQLTFTQDGKLYEATTDADGNYSVEIIQAGEGYTLTVEAEGFETYTETLDITETMTKDIVLERPLPEYTLAEALQVEEGTALRISDDLLVADVEADGTAILTDGNGNWIGTTITSDMLETLQNAASIVGVKGVVSDLNTNPVITLAATPQPGDRTDEVVPETINMEQLIDVPGNCIAEVAGYYANGALRAYSNASDPGQVLNIDNTFIGDALEAYTNKQVMLKAIVRLNAPWESDEATPAPRRVKKGDANSSTNYTLVPVGNSVSDEIITGVADVNANGQVESVTYVNAAGIKSDKPFDGINIVVTRYTDGTVSTTKVVK